MKKLVTLIALILFSFNAWGYILTGHERDVPIDANQYCATANNYWVCIDNYLDRK